MTLQVSASPHIRDKDSTRRLMLDVIIALCPALIASVYIFGFRSLLITAIAVSAAVAFEYLSRRIMRRYNSIGDLSAVVTGLLLALNLPPTVPFWVPVIGSMVAIVVAKQMFGGIGQNFINPALAARVVLTLSFPALMTSWSILAGRAVEAGLITEIGEAVKGTDLVAAATPLYLLRNAGGIVQEGMPTYLQLFIGLKSGCLGEVSILALLVGALYLAIRKVITLEIPLTFLAVVALMTFLAGQDPLYHVLSGGLFLGAFFMATDYVTSPLTRKGKYIFGFGCGLLTGMIRLFGGMNEGVSFSILLMNILTPHLDRWTVLTPFGGGRKNAKG